MEHVTVTRLGYFICSWSSRRRQSLFDLAARVQKLQQAGSLKTKFLSTSVTIALRTSYEFLGGLVLTRTMSPDAHAALADTNAL